MHVNVSTSQQMSFSTVSFVKSQRHFCHLWLGLGNNVCLVRPLDKVTTSQLKVDKRKKEGSGRGAVEKPEWQERVNEMDQITLIGLWPKLYFLSFWLGLGNTFVW